MNWVSADDLVDLRGTMCKPSSVQTTTFGPPPESELFHPTQLPIALRKLSSLSAKANAQARPTLFSHSKPYILYIPTLHHTSSKSRDPFASLGTSLIALPMRIRLTFSII